jgi:hypothetical protein
MPLSEKMPCSLERHTSHIYSRWCTDDKARQTNSLALALGRWIYNLFKDSKLLNYKIIRGFRINLLSEHVTRSTLTAEAHKTQQRTLITEKSKFESFWRRYIYCIRMHVTDVLNIDLLLIFSGYAVAQLVETLCYNPEGYGFDSRQCHRIFSFT